MGGLMSNSTTDKKQDLKITLYLGEHPTEGQIALKVGDVVIPASRLSGFDIERHDGDCIPICVDIGIVGITVDSFDNLGK